MGAADCQPRDYVPRHHQALMTDLYQLTMAAGYFVHGLNRPASFELFARQLAPSRSYLLCAGAAQALAYLETLRFSDAEIDYLRRHPSFVHVPAGFFAYLRDFHFTGEVWAVPEGSPVFADEPIFQVTAPLIEAQLVETYLLAMINFQTLIATKAARVVQAARGRAVIDFGTRRAHGPEAGVLAARAAFIGGCVGTSNTAAGLHAGIPTYGTQAHSWIMAFDDEAESFRRYAEVFPDSAVLLIDTYDVAAGAARAARLGPTIRGVRIDSGDLHAESVRVRRILDERGLAATKILASSDLNEYIIDDLLRRGAPIDAFGVGTELVLSPDAPSIGGVYKLVAMTGADGRSHPKAKYSASKETLPGRKQVYRHGTDETITHDILGLRDTDDAAFPGSERLLVPVMAAGRRLAEPESLPTIQDRARASLARLPETCRNLRQVVRFPVARSPALERLRQAVRSEHAAGSSNGAGGDTP